MCVCVCAELGLSLFSSDLTSARAAYARFIFESSSDEDLDAAAHPMDSRILGTDQFIEKLPVVTHKPRTFLTLDQLAQRLSERYRISPAELCSLSRSRRLTPIRIDFAIQAVDQRIATLADVARFLNRDPSALTRLLARHHTKSAPEP